MADTINTGTMLIEESALMPGSLRFKSEPWKDSTLSPQHVPKNPH